MGLIKQITAKDVEGRRLFTRLQTVIRERSSFQASVVTFEKENKELHRINDLYKIKVGWFHVFIFVIFELANKIYLEYCLCNASVWIDQLR